MSGTGRAGLIARHGMPSGVDRPAAVRLLGLRDQVHPCDVMAFAYRTRAAADDWAAANERNHIPALGQAVTEMGIVVVYDLRPALAAGGTPATPPGNPDSWIPPSRTVRKP